MSKNQHKPQTTNHNHKPQITHYNLMRLNNSSATSPPPTCARM